MRYIVLKAPVFAGAFSVERALSERRSVRKYASDNMDIEQISQLLWAAYGRNKGKRTVPSAGGLYPLVIYLVWRGAVYRYLPATHTMERVKEDGTVLHYLWKACLKQKPLVTCKAVIIVTANYDLINKKYKRRGQRYATLEAGHVGQNISLQATALNLGTVMIGAFHDGSVKKALGIEEEPLYVIPVGVLEDD